MTGLGIAIIGLIIWFAGLIVHNAVESFAEEFNVRPTVFSVGSGCVVFIGFAAVPVGLIWWALEALVL